MNATNRAVNRILLLVVGLAFLGVGLAVVLASSWPTATDIGALALARADGALARAAEATRIGDTGLSWLAVGVLAAIAIIIVLVVVVIARLGGGRTSSVLAAPAVENPLGRVVVKDGFAADALTHSLLARADVYAAKVTAAEVRNETVLHVAITPRRNASPRLVALETDRLASNLEVLTGSALPVYISIRAGLRARLAAEQRDLA